MRVIIVFNLILAIVFIVAMMIFTQLDDIKFIISSGIFSIFNLICAVHVDIINKLK